MNLHGNDFSDITPLAGLHNLETLVLLKNRVSDISPLAGLTKLEHLDIHRVQMSPFSNGADAGDYRRTRGWRAARPQAAQRTLYVDDDGDLDPGGPLTPSLSDPLEDSSPQHPFDRIQEGIDATLDGDLVFVRSGTYWETLIVANKDVTITGIDPDDPNTQHPFPVIDANSLGTAVSFVNSPEGGGELRGFIVTGGADDLAGAIYCDRSQPVISHCVIVGHQVVDDLALSGTVFCIDSNAVITNCTIANNLASPIIAIGSHVAMANCIVWDNGPNELVTVGTGSLSVRYSNVNQTGFPATDSATERPGNTQLQPLFVQPGRWADGAWIPGDYHLHSQIGRWDPKGRAWVQDQVTSPCINAGDPDASVASEPLPNGGIVSMGA